MENLNNLCSQKSNLYSTTRGGLRCTQPQQHSSRLHYGSRGQAKEQTYDRSKATQKSPTKEQTKPMEIKLHTQQRAAKRAGFNDLVATKIYLIELQKQRQEKLLKIIEEEEVRIMRKEMVPKAQLMPFFDRPFFPQRSTRPLTVPREPSFHMLNNKGWSCYSFQQPHDSQPMRPIK